MPSSAGDSGPGDHTDSRRPAQPIAHSLLAPEITVDATIGYNARRGTENRQRIQGPVLHHTGGSPVCPECKATEMIRVFVSSVSKGLEDARARLIAVLRKADYDVRAMEDFGAQSVPPLDVCLRQLRDSDVVALIVGPRYGSELPDGISYTHAEFREAQARSVPVLAFHLTPDPTLELRERDKLDNFLAEVGRAVTWDSAAVDSLPATVMAALRKAESRGELIGRFSLFQPYERYFQPFLGVGAPVFNHDGPFIGRRDQLQALTDFISGAGGLLVLKAPGGAGKSRLLLEAARATSAGGTSKVFFVDPDASWTAADVNRLPDVPTVLIFDDAHRRVDLQSLMRACRQQNDRVRFVVGCRPSALDLVRTMVGQFLGDEPFAPVDLPPLAQEDAEKLATHYLGAEFAHLAKRLVKVADKNPLITRVGARCIVDHEVPPEVLERTEDRFRAIVLDRLLDDPSLRSDTGKIAKSLLETIACIGPVQVSVQDLETKLSALLGVEEYSLRRLIATLEHAGFLSRRGRIVRVSPDVLGDHLLYQAAVDENGNPTRFVERMIDAFAPAFLENILANAAELDWRATSNNQSERVLANTWAGLRARMPAATNRQRADLLSAMKRAALFAPDDVLGLAEWVAKNPDAPRDEDLIRLGFPDSGDRIHRTLTECFGFIAGHPNFTRRCLSWLWQAANTDARAVRQHPDHPKRRIEGLVEYKDRNGHDWLRAGGVHAQTVEFILQRLGARDGMEELAWAVSLLGLALRRIGQGERSTLRQISWWEFSLARYVPEIQPRRLAIIAGLKEVALAGRLKEAKAALHELAQLLVPPQAALPGTLEGNERTVWRPEAEAAIAALEAIASTGMSDVLRFFARRELHVHHPERWPEIAGALHEAWNRCSRREDESLLKVLAGPAWDEWQNDPTAETLRRTIEANKVAIDLWDRYPAVEAVLHVVLEEVDAIRRFGHTVDADYLVRAIVAARVENGEAVVRGLVSAGDIARDLLKPAILANYESHPEVASSLLMDLANSPFEQLRACALEIVQWILIRPSPSDRLFDVVDRLSQDASATVRKTVPVALRRFPGERQSGALGILTRIDWGNDPSIAAAVLDALHPKFALDPNLLTDAGIDLLLQRIAGLLSLDEQDHAILEFVAFASNRRPRQTVAMLLGRILNDARSEMDKGAHRFTPIPYSGYGLALPGLHNLAPIERLDCLRLVRDAQLRASVTAQFWLPELFRVCTADAREAFIALNEWVDSEEAEKIVGAAHLLGGFDHGIVYLDHLLIAALLSAAKKCGLECLMDAKSEIHRLATSGTYTSTPGEPAPRHLQQRARGKELAETYAGTPAGDFYAELVTSAEEDLRREKQRWEEEGDEE
jgi:hypothetical protein